MSLFRLLQDNRLRRSRLKVEVVERPRAIGIIRWGCDSLSIPWMSAGSLNHLDLTARMRHSKKHIGSMQIWVFMIRLFRIVSRGDCEEQLAGRNPR